MAVYLKIFLPEIYKLHKFYKLRGGIEKKKLCIMLCYARQNILRNKVYLFPLRYVLLLGLELFFTWGVAVYSLTCVFQCRV